MYFVFLQELWLFVWEAASNTRYSVSSVGLKKLSCALSLPLRMKYSLCLIRKRFSYLFPRKLMKVLSLSFTSNREDMFDLDSMCNSYCDCANKLDRTHRQVIRMVCTKHVIHLPKRQWSKWIRLWLSCPLFPFKQKRWLLNKSDRSRVLNDLVSDEVNV